MEHILRSLLKILHFVSAMQLESSSHSLRYEKTFELWGFMQLESILEFPILSKIGAFCTGHIWNSIFSVLLQVMSLLLCSLSRQCEFKSPSPLTLFSHYSWKFFSRDFLTTLSLISSDPHSEELFEMDQPSSSQGYHMSTPSWTAWFASGMGFLVSPMVWSWLRQWIQLEHFSNWFMLAYS